MHQAIHGQKGYHGVAILSRLPFRMTGAQQFCGKEDCRHMAVTFQNGVELHDFYVPAGGDIPDPAINEKFAHKLAFLGEMRAMFETRKRDRKNPIVLVGDLNVAPLEHDVWSHKQLLKIVSHTPAEVDLLNAVKNAFDWIDVTRTFVPPQEKIYSWWSYRNNDWRVSDRGRRLDTCLGEPGPQGRRDLAQNPQGRPRLGTTFRPRPGGGGVRRLGTGNGELDRRLHDRPASRVTRSSSSCANVSLNPPVLPEAMASSRACFEG